MSELTREGIERTLSKRFKGINVIVTKLYPQGFKVRTQEAKTLHELEYIVHDIAGMRVVISNTRLWIDSMDPEKEVFFCTAR